MKFYIGFLSFFFATQTWALGVVDHNGFVTDKADILSSPQEILLTDSIRDVEKKTTAEIAILTIKTTNNVPIFDYAMNAAETWGVGKSDTDNGLFVLVAVDDREYQILTGYGLEGTLTDFRTNQISKKNFPLNFRSGDYFSGLNGAILDIGGLLAEDPSIVSKYSTTQSAKDMEPLSIFILFLGAFAMFLLNGWKIFNKEGQVEKTAIVSLVYGIVVGLLALNIVAGIMAAFFLFVWGNLRGTGGVSSHHTDGFGNGSFGGGSFGGFGGGSFGGGGSSGKW